MAATSELDRVTAIVLRYMRTPIIVLIVIYAIAVLGMALMPGRDADGNPAHLSLFHAFYFLSYTATTTGFGELPHPYTDAQRLWALVALYTSIPAWLYAFAAIVRLVQNPHFVQAVALARFSRRVRHLSDPFVLVCGFGDTGSLLVRGLDEAELTAVVLDRHADRIRALALRDYRRFMPGLRADAAEPRHLLAAGVASPRCRAVVAVTRDDAVNVQIAIAARLLNPSVRVLCRVSSREQIDAIEAIGGVEPVNPFRCFAQWLSTALFAPALHTLTHWLVGARGSGLDRPLELATGGHWILCGYGRMGQHLRAALTAHGVRCVVVDPDMEGGEDLPEAERVQGPANAKTLQRADVAHAAGVVAATDDDAVNLAILLIARTLNPDTHVLVRQNRHPNAPAFQAAHATLVMQPTLVAARELLLRLVAPELGPLFEHLRRHGEAPLRELLARLESTVGARRPVLFGVSLTPEDAPAAVAWLRAGRTLTLGDLLRDPVRRERPAAWVPLVLDSGDDRHFLPPADTPLRPGQRLLACGTRSARRRLLAMLNNEYTLAYVATGTHPPRGYAMQWLAGRIEARRAVSG